MLSNQTKSKAKEYATWAVAFIIGVLLVLVPSLIILLRRAKSNSNPSTISWNASDYQSNSDYYKDFSESSLRFNQRHNTRLDRLSSPRFHPEDGSSVVYLKKQYHMPDCNGSTTTLHWTSSDVSGNRNSIQLTRPIWGVHDQQFFWVDSRTILFLSNRASSGLTQIFQLNLPANIGQTTDFIEPIQLTNYPLDIDNLLVNRQASRLAFSCQVYANLSIEETVAQQASEKASGRMAYRFDKLFIRHWDVYMTGLRNHPFVASIQRNSKGTFELTSKPRDILFEIDSDSPTRPFGDAKSQWSFSASGNSFAFTRQHDETSDVAWSTNLDVYTIDLTATTAPIQCISCSNTAADTDPKYSPVDEHILVYRSQSVPGYESDQYKIKLYNGSTSIKTLLDSWDYSIQVITWFRDGQSLLVELGELARNSLYQIKDIQSDAQQTHLLYGFGSSHDINVHPNDDRQFLITNANITSPTNLYILKMNDSQSQLFSLTTHNDNLLRSVKISLMYDHFSFRGARNDTVYGWYVPSPDGTAVKTPLTFLIHGGPQNSWYDTWGFGWNFQVFASQGHAVIAINFHGSDSYGQNFTDSITGEYGTLPYEDLQLGLDAALDRYPYIDRTRAVALGASFGGYMINWIAGHPEMSQRFRTLVCHDGLFDMREMGYATEELWFSEHDAGGFTPYNNSNAYEQYNPINHVINWTQPMLIIHGGRDYRVPDTQGIGAFTALQRKNIPSRLLYFPKENHWILNPLNSLLWFDEVFHWIHRWTT